MSEHSKNQQELHKIFELKNSNEKIDNHLAQRDFAEKFISDYLLYCKGEDFERINELTKTSGLEIEFKRYYFPDDMNYNLEGILNFLKTVARENIYIKPILASQTFINDINNPLAKRNEYIIKYRKFLEYLYKTIRELEFVKNGIALEENLKLDNTFIRNHLSKQFKDNKSYLLMFFLRDLMKGRALHFYKFDLKKFETAEYYIAIDKHSTLIYKKGDSKIRLNPKYSTDIRTLIINDNYNSGYSADNSTIYESILNQAEKIISKYNSDDIKDETKCTICKIDITRSRKETNNKKNCIICQEFLDGIASVNKLYNNKCKPLRKRSEDSSNILNSFRKKKTRNGSLKYCRDLLSEVGNLPEAEHLYKMFHKIFPEAKK